MRVYSDPQPGPVPLPRGRHKLGREAVRASQRERLLRAMLRCVAADGYAATTVTKVAATARVSPNAFYAQFADKADCFLALCDEESAELLAKLVQAGGDVRAAMRIYLSWWRERPESSRAYLLELPSAGERAQQQRRATHERFADMFSALAGAGVSRTAVRVMVGRHHRPRRVRSRGRPPGLTRRARGPARRRRRPHARRLSGGRSAGPRPRSASCAG